MFPWAHLTSCTMALGEGRYRSGHETIAKAISTELERAKPSKKTIAFVRAGEQVTPAARRTSASILTSAKDWQLLVDLERQLKFPSHIATTTLRPDIVLVSELTKQLVLLELTVHVHGSGQWLPSGWIESEEVGCRGFTADSLARALRYLGKYNRSSRDSCGSREKIHWVMVAIWTQAGVWSALVGSYGRGCIMLKDLKCPMIPGTSLKMFPEASAGLFTQHETLWYFRYKCKSWWRLSLHISAGIDHAQFRERIWHNFRKRNRKRDPHKRMRGWRRK